MARDYDRQWRFFTLMIMKRQLQFLLDHFIWFKVKTREGVLLEWTSQGWGIYVTVGHRTHKKNTRTLVGG